MMTIGDVARQAGVRTSTLRYYEEIGLLAPARRVSGQRRYEPEVLQRLAIIRTAQAAGFSLDELRVLLDEILTRPGAAAAWQALIQRKLGELDVLLSSVQQMQNLLREIMDCDGEALAECIFVKGEQYRARTGR